MSPLATGLRILIADGYADVGDSLALLAGLWGHDCLVARSGTEALALARPYRPHVVFSELSLPGMNGYELAVRLRRELDDGITLVALTAFGEEIYRRRSAACGYHFHLVKPVEPDILQGFLAHVRAELDAADGAETSAAFRPHFAKVRHAGVCGPRRL